MSKVEILPCAHCGNEAERVDITAIDNGDPNSGGSYIHCTFCDISGRIFFGEKEGIYEHWNRRCAAPDDGKGQPVALPKVIEEVCSTLRAHTAYQRIGDYKLADKLEAAFSDREGPLVEYFRGDVYQDFGWYGDEFGRGAEENAVYFLRERSTLGKAAPQGWQQGAASDMRDMVRSLMVICQGLATNSGVSTEQYRDVMKRAEAILNGK
jgi:hypothetical protein